MKLPEITFGKYDSDSGGITRQILANGHPLAYITQDRDCYQDLIGEWYVSLIFLMAYSDGLDRKRQKICEKTFDTRGEAEAFAKKVFGERWIRKVLLEEIDYRETVTKNASSVERKNARSKNARL